MMPFALTRDGIHQSEKALENMATGKPIVSTPGLSGQEIWGRVVKIGQYRGIYSVVPPGIETPDPDSIHRGLKMVEANSWERIEGP